MWKKTLSRAYHYHSFKHIKPPTRDNTNKYDINTVLQELKMISYRLQNLERTLQQIVYRNTDGK